MSERFTIRQTNLADVDTIGAGRSLYERLGFVDTSEMRFAGE